MDDIEKQVDSGKEKESHEILETRKDKYMNNLNMEAKASMKSRVITALILTAIVVPCIVLGNYVFAALLLVASVISTHELMTAPQSIEHRFAKPISIIAYLTMIVLSFYIIFRNNLVDLVSLEDKSQFVFDLSKNFYGPQLSLAGFFGCSALFLFASLVDKKFNIKDAFYCITMFLVVGMGFQSILFLRLAPFAYFDETGGIPLDAAHFKYGISMCLLLYVLIGTCFNDIGAYFIGVLFGKHKFAPRISPKKTWEGTIGGVLISFGLTFGFAAGLSAGGYSILPGVLDLEHFYNIIILSIFMPIFATFGDLIFSCVKRNFGIKDFGNILKGHGGFLDRLDSTLITAIMVSVFIEIMGKGWKIF